MKTEPLVLTIDFGTQSVRVCVFNPKGETLALHSKNYEPAYRSPKQGYAEMDPDYYYQCLCECTNALAKEHPDLLEKVQAIEMDCFRDTAVLLDKDKNIIRPSILWLDSRMAKCEKPLPLSSRAIFALVGKSDAIRVNRQRTMANWIKENEPENFKRIDKYVSISTYIVYRLIGELRDSPSNYTGHYPLDYKKKQWYKNPEKHLQGQIFSVRKDQLPELVETGGLLGNISKKGAKESGIPAGTPFFAGGSDKSCETLGCGVFDKDLAAVSLGTACTIETVTEKYKGPQPLLPAYPSIQEGVYNMDVQIYRGFWMINWFLKEFGSYAINDLVAETPSPKEYNDHLFDLPPGSEGLILQPYWGSPLEHPEVKGAVIGFSDYTTKLHFYKAIIEGIGFELRLAMGNLQKRLHHRFRAIRISGGGAKSDEVCQIYADLLGLPVERIQTIEAASLGAAIGGFVALGVYPSVQAACSNMVRVTKTFAPDPKRAAEYDKLYENVYKGLYKSLKKAYRYLYRYTAV